MPVVIQLELILKYFNSFKDFKVFTGLGLHHLTTSTCGWVAGWVGGMSETGYKAISASIAIEIELS